MSEERKSVMGLECVKPSSISFQIESLIDANSLLDVLVALECICAEKAEHIAVNWQDAHTARPWREASTIIGTALRKIEPKGI